jgi:predicted AlkP superfamily phosphohydrolase/phosphomutase
MTKPSVLMLGLDAADATIIERLTQSGDLPNLQRLRADGLYGRLGSPAGLYAGGVWPTFYTGRDVPGHGVYHSKLWRAERMRVEVASDAWLAVRPFWELLPEGGPRVCIIDVPMVIGTPRAVHGVYLGGWGTHDVLSRGSAPSALWQELERRYGAPAMPPEHFGRQSERSLERLPDVLVKATQQLATIAVDLMQRESWDLTCVVFGAVHRAGHYLWDRSQIERAGDPVADGALSPGLLRVYQAVDAAVGELVAKVQDETLVLAFAVHGMGPNPGWSDLLPDILAQLDAHAAGGVPRQGMLYRVKRRIPFHWARPFLTRVPASLQNQLVSLWSRNMFDWPTTRYFPLPMDEAGYLRINLRGRERDGIVQPGAEYNALCDELAGLMLSLRDGASGLPIADRVVRAYAEAPPDAPAGVLLPDLVIPFTGPRATTTRSLVSTRRFGYQFAVPPTLPSGRSGNHTDRAWFIARGAAMGSGRTAGTQHVIDLIPTALAHLGIAPTPGIEGSPIDRSAST